MEMPTSKHQLLSSQQRINTSRNIQLDPTIQPACCNPSLRVDMSRHHISGARARPGPPQHVNVRFSFVVVHCSVCWMVLGWRRADGLQTLIRGWRAQSGVCSSSREERLRCTPRTYIDEAHRIVVGRPHHQYMGWSGWRSLEGEAIEIPVRGLRGLTDRACFV